MKFEEQSSPSGRVERAELKVPTESPNALHENEKRENFFTYLHNLNG